MIGFTQLYLALDATTKTNEKIGAMVEYFATATPSDAAWAIWFLSGNRLRRLVSTKLLRQWAATQANIPDWLFDESYHAVGDLAETISLVVPEGTAGENTSLSDWIENRLLPLKSIEESEQRRQITTMWDQSTASTRLVSMKLVTGAFRVGVSRRLVARAIAKHADIPVDVISHRLMGNWKPTDSFFERLVDPDVQDAVDSQPYPFCLAHPLDDSAGVKSLGDISNFIAEWKWDGIRGQLIRRRQQTFLWSRGEELMENRWPEIESAAEWLPDGTVIDGEILAAFPDGKVLPFSQLQRRINRKKVGKKLLTEVPVVFHAFDLLERDGTDVRTLPLASRREQLEAVLSGIEHPHLQLNPILLGDSWEDFEKTRQQSREMHAEGLMVKRKESPYDVGRVRGSWWKWKIAPQTIDAVLIYAQKGHGKRASLFTDYTFAVWDGDRLVPFAKAYSGLDDREIREVDRFVRRNTQDAFGPVRSVAPELVMELAFEGLQRSTRHKSGVATRFPRIVRWRHDKGVRDANTLDDLLALLPQETPQDSASHSVSS